MVNKFIVDKKYQKYSRKVLKKGISIHKSGKINDVIEEGMI